MPIVPAHGTGRQAMELGQGIMSGSRQAAMAGLGPLLWELVARDWLQVAQDPRVTAAF